MNETVPEKAARAAKVIRHVYNDRRSIWRVQCVLNCIDAIRAANGTRGKFRRRGVRCSICGGSGRIIFHGTDYGECRNCRGEGYELARAGAAG